MEPRGCLGIGCLKREQLTYELQIRGQSAEGSVADLATRLRDAVHYPISITDSIVGEVGATINVCTEALSGVRENVVLLESSSPSRKQIYRVQAQISHWVNRIRDLKQIKTSKEQGTLIGQLLTDALELQGRLSNLGWSDVDTGDQEKAQLIPGTKEMGEVVQAVGAHMISEPFARLPNPIMHLFQGVDKLGVSDLEQIVDLLWRSVKFEAQADALGVAHSVILQLLYPLAQGALSQIIADVLHSKGTLGDLRKRVIQGRVTQRVKQELIGKYLLRVQSHEETLEQYIEAVRTAISALEVDMTEREVVDNILEGIKPDDRSRLIFSSRPTTFRELEGLVSRIEGIRFADQKRDSLRRAPPTSSHQQIDRGPRAGAPSREQVCFRCRESGHFVKDCPVKKRVNS